MPNFNKHSTTTCPRCLQERLARNDVISKAFREGKELHCKPCRNKDRFAEVDHPTKGTGVKNDPDKAGAYKSYTRAKRRSNQGEIHHRAYRDVDFNFKSFDDFFKLLGPRPLGYTLDRIDPLGHYEEGNVRWATIKQQTENRLPRGYWLYK